MRTNVAVCGVYVACRCRLVSTIPWPNDRMADANGNIFVTPGNRIPAIPAHRKAVGEAAVTDAWKVGVDITAVGSQYVRGDDSNLNEKVPAYWVTNLHTSY
jgi:iron complex outermembrane receptor protein